MRRFVDLCLALDSNAPDASKRDALVRYLETASVEDARWAVELLTVRKRMVPTHVFRQAASAAAGIPAWLFTASYEVTRDLAETAALLVPAARVDVEGSLAQWIETRLAPLSGLGLPDLADGLLALWRDCDRDARVVVNRILIGTSANAATGQLVMDAVQTRSSDSVAHPAASPSSAPISHQTTKVARNRAERSTTHASSSSGPLHEIRAVLLYAQPGSGRHASLQQECTFAVWDGDALVAFAKAHLVLPDAQARALDSWIRSHTIEKFGPVRSVTPELVFDLAFEAIELSARHKCGLRLQGVQVLRWRREAAPSEAGSLSQLQAFAAGASVSSSSA